MDKERSPSTNATRKERGIPDEPSPWVETSSTSRDIVMVYSGNNTLDTNATPAGGLPGSLSSARGKSPRPARPPTIQSIPEHHEIVAQERLHVRKYPKSPKKPKLGVTSDETAGKLGHSRLRSTTTSRTRGHSPSTPRGHIEEDELQDVLAEIIRDQTLTLARAARRHSKSSASRSQVTVSSTRETQQETPTSRTSVHSSGRSSAPSVTAVVEAQDESLVKGGAARRTKTRRQKRKVDVAQDHLADVDAATAAAATCCEERRTSLPGFKPFSGLQQFVSRVRTRKGGDHESTSTTSKSSWMQLFGDIILWKNVPRSALLFGGGCFCILSSTFVNDVRCGALTVTAYMALIYLGAVFVHRNFLRGGSSQLLGKNWEVCEADALEVLRVCLPAVNVALKKCGELFCGEPSITLKVATILWLLAQAGYFMTIWSFARLSFLLMFSLPKLYICYSYQLHGQVEASIDRLRKAWSAYAHKKVALLVTFILAWNMSSATSRLYGAFLLLVAFKLYTRQLAEQRGHPLEFDPKLAMTEPAANIKSITTSTGIEFRPPQERRKKGNGCAKHTRISISMRSSSHTVYFMTLSWTILAVCYFAD